MEEVDIAKLHETLRNAFIFKENAINVQKMLILYWPSV